MQNSFVFAQQNYSFLWIISKEKLIFTGRPHQNSSKKFIIAK
jgi:hypothetical protein